MKRTIQVRIGHGGSQFVAECLDLPVVTQAPTLDELAVNIREAIGLHLEGEDLAQLGFCPDPTMSGRHSSGRTSGSVFPATMLTPLDGLG